MQNKLEGIGWFTYETFKRIVRAHPEHTFWFVFDRGPVDDFRFSDNVKTLILHPPARHPFLWWFRYEILFPFVIKYCKADLFVSPDGWMTLGTKVKCVQVLHDLNFEHKPKDLPFFTRWYYRYFFKRYALKARRIATVSNYSKQDIVKTYQIPAAKIDVAHNGCNEYYSPTTEEEKDQTRDRYTGNSPYFLYVGALIPRKNIIRMYEAFDRFKAQDQLHTKLVMVGSTRWATSEIKQALENMKYRQDVIFLGRRQTKELRQLYSAARALLFVPCFEGFGIPILEAFYCETAVITSNITSMPEVAGDAALLTDPYSVASIAQAMIQISTNEQLRAELISKGKKQRELFSWNKTAEKLWDCMMKAVENPEKD